MPAMTIPSSSRSKLKVNVKTQLVHFDQETYYKLHAALTAVKHIPMMPTQVTILLIQACGLTRDMIRLDGKSKIT